MPTHHSLLSLTLATALMLGGCKKEDNPVAPPEAAVADLYPLQVGAEWIYESILLNEDGSVSDTLDTDYRIVNQKDTVVSGQHWTLTSNGEAYSKQTDGIHYDYSYPFRGVGGLLFKNPARVGDEYLSPFQEPGMTISIRVISTNASVTVRAGTFSCYQYDILDKNSREVGTREFIAPGVGLVRRERLDPSSTGGAPYVNLRTDLVSYSPSSTARPTASPRRGKVGPLFVRGE